METTLVLIGCVVGGLVIGSFLTVVVDRVPRGASIVAPPSACGACGLRLGPVDLVPVASWLALRGKCRQCRTPIGIEPIVIELATATIFVIFGLHFGADAALPAFLVLGAALVALTWIDLREQRLPREISYTALVLGAIALTIAALVRGEPERIWQMALGAGIALAIMGTIHVASRGGMGEGDVRLAPLLGAYLGWLNPASCRSGCSTASCSAQWWAWPSWPSDRPDAARPYRSARSWPRARCWPCSRAKRWSICCGMADQMSSLMPPSTPYIADTSAIATKPTMRPTKMIMIGSNSVVNRLMRYSSSRLK
jgi:leader peptidase (prepilin peptidase) / N-methyltransferase